MKQKAQYVTIYRVESKKDGLGPYRSSFCSASLDDKLHKKTSALLSASHPAPQNDGIPEHSMTAILFAGSRWLCAFDSMAQLKTWFKGCLTDLKKSGFIIAKYRILKSNVLIGEHQIVFAEKGAKKIG